MVIWIIGLAGAGKTTVGRRLYRIMKAENKATAFLDGDDVREIMGSGLGHGIEDRRTNGRRIQRLCAYLDRQQIDVVCAVLSLFPDQQQENRSLFSRYIEVYLDVSEDTLAARDQKGLYSGARAGRISNVVGVDIPFPAPKNPDLVVKNDGGEGELDAAVAAIFQHATMEQS